MPWNDGPKCLSTGSHPFPSLSLRFFHAFPKQRACSQAIVHLTFIATVALHVQIVTKNVLCHFAFRCQNCTEAGYRCHWCTYRGVCTDDVKTECPGEFILPIQVC